MLFKMVIQKRKNTSFNFQSADGTELVLSVLQKKENGFSILENIANWESSYELSISDLQKMVFANRKYINLELQRQKKDYAL